MWLNPQFSGHIYWRNPNGKFQFLCSAKLFFYLYFLTQFVKMSPTYVTYVTQLKFDELLQEPVIVIPNFSVWFGRLILRILSPPSIGESYNKHTYKKHR